MTLKIITHSQYLKASKAGSYELDDASFHLADLADLDVQPAVPTDIFLEEVELTMSQPEENSFDYYAEARDPCPLHGHRLQLLAQSTSCKEQHEQNEPEKMPSHQQADDCATSPCCATMPNCVPTPSCATTPSHIADAPDEPPRFCSTLSTNQNQMSDDNPSLPMPTNDLDKQARQARGPFQPHLGSYAQTETNNRKRSFCEHWFAKFSWLEYSPAKDAAFCFCGRAFPPGSGTKAHLDPSFVSTGFRAWKKAIGRFNQHERSEGHLNSVVSWNCSKANRSIGSMLDESFERRASQVEEKRKQNREVLKRLTDIVVLLSKGGRPFRGHSENKESAEQGLYLEIVNILKKYDPVLRGHLESGPKNASYISNRIKKDILESLHAAIFSSIVHRIEGKTVSLMCDETSDCSHHEQLSVVIRYFCEIKNRPVEVFLTLDRLKNLDSDSVFSTLQAVLNTINVSWNSASSVCFDGASTMSGHVAGVQAKCKEQNNKLVYVHC
ncbi:zinc finger MYM-type protein 1-like isoform X1 [Ixodes scapularis]|uniref:zinc finger MYM-type protein 1-like isoform X1 n=1 Tax=Ixodes scapularis TaxID=6945 RepID=UPI0011617ADA|nr:zinc finger MYM-type protein 1-like isoform X1 [Ixodes scapularis]